MDYGFLVPGNPHDRVMLRYDVDLMQVGGGDAAEVQGCIWCCSLPRCH
jgi:hypothetical protein